MKALVLTAILVPSAMIIINTVLIMVGLIRLLNIL